MDTQELKNEIEAHIVEQIKSSNHKCKEMTAILNSFTEDIHLLKEGIDCHCDIFIKIYEETSTGKERYLQFQIEWHAKCSLFLLPKHMPTDENASKAAAAFREGWSRFKETSTHSVDDCDRIMILFSSALYNILLHKIHLQSIKSSAQVQTEDIVNADGDDVYFRFGGAVISDMLHLRYKQIRTCRDSEKKSSISEQISIVQSMNTKEKLDMPEYLQYRDRGFMYSPHLRFIPFFRNVDTCVKEVVNDDKFKQYGEDLIKVHMICMNFMNYFTRLLIAT